MNRREALKLLGSLLFVPPFLDSERSVPDYLLIVDSDFDAALSRRLVAGTDVVLSPRDAAWKTKLVTWDLRRNEKQIRDFIFRFGYNTETFSWPLLIAVPPQRGLADDVEIFSVEWLAHLGNFEKACYPISGGWWSVDGDFNPPIEKVQKHCFESPNHASGKFQNEWLIDLKFEEIQSLHSDHHREMVKQGKVHWKHVNAECPI